MSGLSPNKEVIVVSDSVGEEMAARLRERFDVSTNTAVQSGSGAVAVAGLLAGLGAAASQGMVAMQNFGGSLRSLKKTRRKSAHSGYFGRHGEPHGFSGAKLLRKAMRGTVGKARLK
jgi:hypothetical protein